MNINININVNMNMNMNIMNIYEQKKRDLKNKLMETEVQLSMTNNLQSLQQDRREWSLILILILIDNDEVMQEYFIKQNLMSYVIPFLQPHNHQELKILAFDVLKEIYADRVQLAIQFLNSSERDAASFWFFIFYCNWFWASSFFIGFCFGSGQSR